MTQTTEYRLTEFANTGGCAAKLSPLDLGKILREVRGNSNPDVLVGFDRSDDAGVYRINDELAIVQTLDLITPVADDPFLFGQIAAANSLSDVYAMGGTPITALNICCLPMPRLPSEAVNALLAGGLQKVEEAGAALLGGHTVRDDQLKYGLSITGVIHPREVVTNAGAQVGDRLILTKPIGTGILVRAIRLRRATVNDFQDPLAMMATLNKTACHVMKRFGANACTDVTGFGLAGHSLEIAKASGVGVQISIDAIPAYEFSRRILNDRGDCKAEAANRALAADFYFRSPTVDSDLEALMFDPQTSGGLLISVAESKALPMLQELRAQGVVHAAIIGEVIESAIPNLKVV